MSAAAEAEPGRIRRPLPLLLLLAAAGLAGNALGCELFFGIELVWGSAFTMLAVQALGPGWGAAAGLVASSITWPNWGHPWAMVTMTAEAAVVGLLFWRRGVQLVVADTLFWLGLGMPLLLLAHGGVMGMPATDATIIALKGALNGVGNTVAARLAFLPVGRRLGLPPPAFREVVFNFLMLFLLTPSLLLVALQSRNEVRRMERAVQGAFHLVCRRVATSVEAQLEAHRRRVVHLAALAATLPTAQMQSRLEEVLIEDPDFVLLGLMDETAVSIAFAPLTDELGQTSLGLHFSDRSYLPILKGRLQPMLSETMLARVGAPRPIAAVLAPVLRDGAFAGFIGGALDLERMKESIAVNVQAHSLPGLLFALVDRHSHIIASNRPGAAIMTDFARGEGEPIVLAAGLRAWLPRARQSAPVAGRWQHAFYVAEYPIGSLAEWTLMLDQPIAPFQQEVRDRYAGYLAQLLALLLGAMAVAWLTSRRAVATLATLAGISRDLPARVAAGAPIPWPEPDVAEAGLFLASFQDMAAMLRRQFQEIQALNVELEGRVQERTRQLAASREEYRLLAENSSDVAWRIDLATMRFTYISPSVAQLLGFTPQEIMARPFATVFTPESLAAARTWIGQAVAEFAAGRTNPRGPIRQVAHPAKDGSTVWTEISTSYLLGPDGKAVGLTGISRDITRRKVMEDRLRESEARFRSLFENLHVVSLIIDPATGRIVDANPAAAVFYGWSRETLRAMTVMEINTLPPETVQAEMARAHTEERHLFRFQHRRADGSIREVEVYSGPATWEGGTVLYSIVHDVTSRLEAERALLDKTRQLEDLTANLERRVEAEIAGRRKHEQLLVQQSKLAAMGEMLGAIAHQWRQPLNTLGLCVQNIRDAWQFGELNQALLDETTDKALAQVRHMSRTIDDFRGFFLPDKERQVFDAMAAAGEVVSLFSAQLAAHGIRCAFVCHTHGVCFDTVAAIEACPAKTVTGFRNELEHVLLNLVNNAKDAIIAKARRGGFAAGETGRILFEFSRTPTRLTIQVADNGGGIPAAIMDRIFEPYFTTKGPGLGGTGIGLYLSRVIIEEHMGGTLTAEGSEAGAVFTIQLPAAPLPAACQEAADAG
ncbi:MAG: PAS domain S-box protein [Thermodesulfobacteriota bacterium]